MSTDARRHAAGLLATAGLLALGLAPREAATRAARVLRDDSLNRSDTERMERGYYEALLDAGRRLDRMPGGGAAFAPRSEIPFDVGPLGLGVADLREFVLRPGLAMELDTGRWTTNSLGLRDREYDAAKPAGTVRVALLGDSIGVGWGVDDAEVFEARVEAALDARSRAAGGPAVEIWNFSVPGHAPGQRWEHFSRLGWSSSPDLVLYEATPADPGWDERRLRGLLPAGLGWDAPQYREALARAGVRPGGDFEHYKAALRSHRWALLEGVYRTIVSECHGRGLPTAWALVPRVGKRLDEGERARLVGLARAAGFDAVFDLTGAYDGADPASLAIAPDDYHPNADGHARLARRLEADLAARSDLLPTRPRTAPGDRR